MLCYAAWSLGVPPWLRLNRLYEPRILQARTNRICERVCATEYAPHGRLHVLERTHGLADISECGDGVLERSRVRRRQRRVSRGTTQQQ